MLGLNINGPVQKLADLTATSAAFRALLGVGDDVAAARARVLTYFAWDIEGPENEPPDPMPRVTCGVMEYEWQKTTSTTGESQTTLFWFPEFIVPADVARADAGDWFAAAVESIIDEMMIESVAGTGHLVIQDVQLSNPPMMADPVQNEGAAFWFCEIVFRVRG